MNARLSPKLLAVCSGLALFGAGISYSAEPSPGSGVAGASQSIPRDSLNSELWRNYLEPQQLATALLPPRGSPYRKYVVLGTALSVRAVKKSIKPGYAPADDQARKDIAGLAGVLNSTATAIILDCDGPRSVAMAEWLVKNKGFQPVVMLAGAPQGSDSAAQSLASLLYFAASLKEAKASTSAHAPPVFILDRRRVDLKPQFRLTARSLPAPNEYGLEAFVYVHEGAPTGLSDKGVMADDIPESLRAPFVRFFGLAPVQSALK